MATGGGHDLKLGADIDETKPRDQEFLERAGNANVEAPRLQIDDQVDTPAQLVRPEGDIVAGDLAGARAQHALRRQVAQDAADHCIDAGDARDLELDRHGQRQRRQPPATARVYNLEPLLAAELQAICGQAIIEARAVECPVEHRAQLDIAATRAVDHARGVEHAHPRADIAIATGREIDRARGVERERARAQRESAVEHAVDQRPRSLHGDARREHPRGLAPDDGVEPQRAAHRVAPRIIAECQIERVGACDLPLGGTAPARPAPLARHRERQRLADAGKLREQPVGGASRVQIKVEPVVVGRGVEHQLHIVAAFDPRGELYQRAAIANVAARHDPPDPLGAGHARPDHQPVDRQPPDADVETGQDRPALLPGIERWRLDERGGRNVERVDVEPVAEPRQRPPVEFGARHRQHGALGIADAHVDQRRFRPDRARDPPDRKAQTARGALRGNLVGDQPVANACVDQPDAEARRHQQQRDQRGDPTPPAPAWLDRGGFAQNDCPRET